MSLSIGSGRMVIKDVDDHVVFDSDEGLFNAIGFYQGSVTLPQRVSRGRGSPALDEVVDVDIDHPLASINPDADTVVGAFQAVGGGQGLSDLGYFNACGSYVHFQAPPISLAGDWINHPDSVAVYTFKAGGGALVLNERVFLRIRFTADNILRTLTLFSTTFHYRLYVGRFV